jgi:hypothetical protein
VKFVAQPTDETCGQACVAMLTGETVEEVCRGIGNFHATTPFEIQLATRVGSNYSVTLGDLQLATFENLVDEALVSFANPIPWACAHWVLFRREPVDPARPWGLRAGYFYDPAAGLLAWEAALDYYRSMRMEPREQMPIFRSSRP